MYTIFFYVFFWKDISLDDSNLLFFPDSEYLILYSIKVIFTSYSYYPPNPYLKYFKLLFYIAFIQWKIGFQSNHMTITISNCLKKKKPKKTVNYNLLRTWHNICIVLVQLNLAQMCHLTFLGKRPSTWFKSFTRFP